MLRCSDAPSVNDIVQEFNIRLREIAISQNAKVIDLNTHIAPNKILLPEFTSDGVHFSASAYAIWARELRKMLAPATKIHEIRGNAE